ncbi:conjugal transfer protein [Streptomyces sp. JNUCC 64]
MTDQHSPAGGDDGTRPPAGPGQFGAPDHTAWQQPQAPAPYGRPQQPQPPAASEAARAQVAAAWTRRAPQAAVPPAEAAVPPLPPRAGRPTGSAQDAKATAKADKRERRERERAERKAAYERKKAEREARKSGRRGDTPAAVPPPVGTAAVGTPTGTAPGAATTSGAAGRTGAPGAATRGAAGGADGAVRAGGFDVPRPGGRLPSRGRRTHVALRATLLVTTCAFALGSCGVVGLVIGKSSSTPTAALDAEDVRRYQLTEFPTRAAATFAEKYATLCLTHDPKAADRRRAEMARYTTAGVDADCGWNGRGTQRVTLATWDGGIEALPEYGKNGRYLNVQVTLATGRVTSVSVPVFVTDPATGSGLRVVGDVGEMPLPARGEAPEVDRQDEVVDDTLSDQLKAKVLPGYFTAWGGSDTTAMSRFTTSDATVTATTGLAGALVRPRVETVEALAPAGSDGDGEIVHRNGQTVAVRVTVLWDGPDGKADEARKDGGEPTVPEVRRSYRLKVVNTAQGWFIKDVRGAVLDPTGGSGDADEAEPAETTGPSGGTPAGADDASGDGPDDAP